MNIDVSLLYSSIPQLLQGALVTIQIALTSFFFGITGGTIIGLLQTKSNSFMRMLCTIYVTLIRGTPMLIQITFFYYVLPAVGISLSPLWAAICAIGLNSSAYVSQIVKAGINAVGNDQLEAARVLGFSQVQIIRFIIMPQALQTIFPALISECVTLIKDSSLASILGVLELYKVARMIMNQTYDVITIFCLVAFCYLVLTSMAELILRFLERKIFHVTHS